MRLTISTISLLGLLTSSPAALSAVLIPIAPIPGSIWTNVYGINDSNTLVGGYATPDNKEHGFFGPLSGPYTTFDYGGSPYTEGRGINNAGYITGYAVYDDASEQEFERYPDGRIKTIKIDGGPLAAGASIVQGINSKGLFVGDYFPFNGGDGGAYYGKKAKYLSALTLPGDPHPRPRGINDSGVVAGRTGTHGFLLSDGAATLIDYPDERAASTVLTGINKHGVAVGSWCDASCDVGGAFTFDMKSSSFVQIKVPHVKNISAWAINSAGLIIINAGGQDFVYCPHSAQSGKCPAGGFEVPGGAIMPTAPIKYPYAIGTHKSRPMRPGALLNQK